LEGRALRGCQPTARGASDPNRVDRLPAPRAGGTRAIVGARRESVKAGSGLISILAEVYASTNGKTDGLTADDVKKAGPFLEGIERAVVHYGESTGFFGERMFGNDLAYLNAAVLYENMVIEAHDKQKYPDLPAEVVAISSTRTCPPRSWPSNAAGSVTLQLVGPSQKGFSPPPARFHYTITGGTGKYAGASGRGRVAFQEQTTRPFVCPPNALCVPLLTTGTFTMTFRPAAG
jgi:hypothetical protein